MKDSYNVFVYFVLWVVNCFQKLLSSWWRTALKVNGSAKIKLWIAFKNYYLRDEGQHSSVLPRNVFRCELLSKIIIFVMKDSNLQKRITHRRVVNCFQKLLSSWWRTAKAYNYEEPQPLWIAFKNYYLRDEGQQKSGFSRSEGCCELLSKIIIFVMKDSFYQLEKLQLSVVNCFQKLLSSWWRTAFHNKYNNFP